MNVELLRDVNSGAAALPLIIAQQNLISAQLQTDEYARILEVQKANLNHATSMATAFNQPGMTSLQRRRLLQQTIAATRVDRSLMLVEQDRRGSLGHFKCATCTKVKRGVPHKEWLRPEHMVKMKNTLVQQDPEKYNYCSCYEKINAKWHNIHHHSKCMDCLTIKTSGLMPLLQCGHRVYCNVCIERHAFCPLCSRRYIAPKFLPKNRLHQSKYCLKEEEVNEKFVAMGVTRRDQERTKREKITRLGRVKHDIVHGIRVDGAAGGGLVLESEQIVSYRSRRKLVPWLSRGRRERLKMRTNNGVGWGAKKHY